MTTEKFDILATKFAHSFFFLGLLSNVCIQHKWSLQVWKTETLFKKSGFCPETVAKTTFFAHFLIISRNFVPHLETTILDLYDYWKTIFSTSLQNQDVTNIQVHILPNITFYSSFHMKSISRKKVTKVNFSPL